MVKWIMCCCNTVLQVLVFGFAQVNYIIAIGVYTHHDQGTSPNCGNHKVKVSESPSQNLHSDVTVEVFNNSVYRLYYTCTNHLLAHHFS